LKKTILFLFFCLISLQYSYCKNTDKLDLSNTFSETSYYINRAGVAAETGWRLVATGIAGCFVGTKSYSTSLISESPLYFGGMCFVGSAVCIFVIAYYLVKAGVKLKKLDLKDNSLIIKID